MFEATSSKKVAHDDVVKLEKESKNVGKKLKRKTKMEYCNVIKDVVPIIVVSKLEILTGFSAIRIKSIAPQIMCVFCTV